MKYPNINISLLVWLGLIQFVILIFLFFAEQNQSKIERDNPDFFQAIDIILNLPKLYKLGMLDSTKLISVDLVPYSKLDGFYDAERNVLYHRYGYFVWSETNNLSMFYLEYNETKDTLLVNFSLGDAKGFNWRLYKENGKWK